MKKFLCKASLLICMSATCFALESPLGLPYSKDIKSLVKRGDLRVAIYADSSLSPFVIINGKQLEGYNVDMARAIAAELGVKLHIDRATSYNDAVALVAKGKDDIAISNVTATPQRALSVFFTEPYYSMPQGLIIQKNFDASKLNANTRVVSEESLRIGVEAESAYVYYVSLAFPHATVVAYANLNQGLKDLNNNQCDAIFVDDFSGEQVIAGESALTLFRLGDVHIDPVTMVVSSEKPQLLNWLNLYLNSLEGKVTQATLKQKVQLP
ncbi:MAG: ABC transporter substrate-binding protein [Pseudomonadota bacterium]